MFKKGDVFKMKEAEFQEKVLIPLFRKMGFQDVTAFGGGSLERGKDIVMWKQSEFDQRINFGVVVKAKKITGNAETNEGAMNVLNQVRQMLKTSYVNPVNGDKETIKRCVVACSKDVTKEAMNSIEGELSNDLDKVLEWIHPGTNLFQMLDKYFPEMNTLEKLAEVQDELDEAMKIVPYRLIARSDNKFSIVAKHPKAYEEMPFNITTKFKFSDDDAGKQARQKLNDFFTKGKDVVVDGKYVESFLLPDFLPDYIRDSANQSKSIMLRHNATNTIIPARLERHIDGSGEVVMIDRVDLLLTHPGSEETTFSNRSQAVPWLLEIVADFKKRNFTVDFKFEFFNYNLVSHIKSLKFLLALNKEGNTKLIDSNTERDLFPNSRTKLSDKPEDIKYFETMVEFLEDLLVIQNAFNIFFTFTEDLLRNDTIKIVENTATSIKTGKFHAKIKSVTTLVTLDKAKEALEIFKDRQPFPLFSYANEGSEAIISGNTVNTGPFILSGMAYLTEETCNRIAEEVAAEHKKIEIEHFFENEDAIYDFLNFDCPDRLTRIPYFEEVVEDLRNQ